MRHLAAAALLALALAPLACSAAEDDARDPLQPPPGCKQTACDLENSACMSRVDEEYSDCTTNCANVAYQYKDDCTSDCAVAKADSLVECDTADRSCRKMRHDAYCADGMDARDMPTWSYWFGDLGTPAAPAQGACSEDDITALMQACFAGDATTTSCDKFRGAHSACSACVITSKEGAWGPYVVDSNRHAWVNYEGCVASVAGNADCASKVYKANLCLDGCQSARDIPACVTWATNNECKDETDAANACLHDLGADQPGSPFAVCGDDVPFTTMENFRKLVQYFCGQ